MFRNPALSSYEVLPHPPIENPLFLSVATAMDVTLEPHEPLLPQLIHHAQVEWLDRSRAAGNVVLAQPHEDFSQHELLREVGLIDSIRPPKDRYDHALVDGGSLGAFYYRLKFAQDLADRGVLSDITIFAGQCKRLPEKDSFEDLSRLTAELYPYADDWGKRWLEAELLKDPNSANIWDRPFASEHQLAILALMRLYGNRLKHTQTVLRQQHVEQLPGFPGVPVFAEKFSVSDLTLSVLDSPAIIRTYGDHTLAPHRARATGRSCFADWLNEVPPARGASVLLITQNPHIYRSWLDLALGRDVLGRSDLEVDAAGPPMAPRQQLEHVARALGTIYINFSRIRDSTDDSTIARSN